MEELYNAKQSEQYSSNQAPKSSRVLALILSCYEHTKWAHAKKIEPQSHQKHFTAEISLFGGEGNQACTGSFLIKHKETLVYSKCRAARQPLVSKRIKLTLCLSISEW